MFRIVKVPRIRYQLLKNKQQNHFLLQRAFSAEVHRNVLLEKVENITVIGINRPEKRNCVNLATANELHEAFKTFENDSTSPVAVLYGKGGNFSAGLDLKEISQFPPDFDFIKTNNYNPVNTEGIGPMVLES